MPQELLGVPWWVAVPAIIVWVWVTFAALVTAPKLALWFIDRVTP